MSNPTNTPPRGHEDCISTVEYLGVRFYFSEEFGTHAHEASCPACERGEGVITPPHSKIVGTGPVHHPSGNICVKARERGPRR